MGAGDDEHGDGADDRVVGQAHERPHEGGDDRRPQGEPEQPCGGGVGDALGAGGGVLGVGDELLDTGQGGVVPGGGDLDAQPRVGGDGAGDDLRSGLATHRLGLAGDHRLVHRGRAVDDLPVGGH